MSPREPSDSAFPALGFQLCVICLVFNQTKPNQTKPNQTKPNQTKPNTKIATSEMAQWVKVLAIKPKGQSSIPRTLMIEGYNQP